LIEWCPSWSLTIDSPFWSRREATYGGGRGSGDGDYEAIPRKKIRLPKRQERGVYEEPNYPYKFVPEKY
jgi:hypothetical protein